MTLTYIIDLLNGLESIFVKKSIMNNSRFCAWHTAHNNKLTSVCIEYLHVS